MLDIEQARIWIFYVKSNVFVLYVLEFMYGFAIED